MNSTLLMMAALGGRMDAATLRKVVSDGNAKRKQLYMRMADILFHLVFYLWGGLEYKVTDAAGKEIAEKDLSPDQKLNALMAAAKTTQKGQLFREFLKPLVIAAAEFLADAMAPDELMLSLVSGAPGGLPALPGVSVPFTSSGALGGGSTPSGYEGQLLGASDNPTDGHVYRIEGGRKRWVMNPDVLKRYVSGVASSPGRWEGVNYVPQSVIDSFPTGAPLS
jgi:hypothetical protein